MYNVHADRGEYFAPLFLAQLKIFSDIISFFKEAV